MNEPAHEIKVRVFVRHKKTCDHVGEEGHANCRCAKWLRYTRHGKQFRQPANTRSFGTAEEKARELERRLNAGESPVLSRPNQPKMPTIADKIETFIIAKQTEGLSTSTRRKLKYQLGLFEQFMAGRSIFFPAEVTTEDVIKYRATWKWKSGVTRQKAQQNLRGFLRLACEGKVLEDLLKVLKPIKLSREDTVRLKPRPFSARISSLRTPFLRSAIAVKRWYTSSNSARSSWNPRCWQRSFSACRPLCLPSTSCVCAKPTSSGCMIS